MLQFFVSWEKGFARSVIKVLSKKSGNTAIDQIDFSSTDFFPLVYFFLCVWGYFIEKNKLGGFNFHIAGHLLHLMHNFWWFTLAISCRDHWCRTKGPVLATDHAEYYTEDLMFVYGRVRSEYASFILPESSWQHKFLNASLLVGCHANFF